MLEGHEDANPLQHLLEGNLRQRVIEAIEALPEREKMVLTLYYRGRAEPERNRSRAGSGGIPRQPAS